MTFKIKDRYFNYDNVAEMDFQIRAAKRGVEGLEDKKYYLVRIVSNNMTLDMIELTKKEWENAQSKFEAAIIWGNIYTELTNSEGGNGDE